MSKKPEFKVVVRSLEDEEVIKVITVASKYALKKAKRGVTLNLDENKHYITIE